MIEEFGRQWRKLDSAIYPEFFSTYFALKDGYIQCILIVQVVKQIRPV